VGNTDDGVTGVSEPAACGQARSPIQHPKQKQCDACRVRRRRDPPGRRVKRRIHSHFARIDPFHRCFFSSDPRERGSNRVRANGSVAGGAAVDTPTPAHGVPLVSGPPPTQKRWRVQSSASLKRASGPFSPPPYTPRIPPPVLTVNPTNPHPKRQASSPSPSSLTRQREASAAPGVSNPSGFGSRPPSSSSSTRGSRGGIGQALHQVCM
jgi:hypothetical protein